MRVRGRRRRSNADCHSIEIGCDEPQVALKNYYRGRRVLRKVFQFQWLCSTLLVACVVGANGDSPVDYQLTAQAGESTHLPCLIGRPAYCGEPYLIAWYKLNATSKSWSRLEHSVAAADADSGNNERLKFVRPRGANHLTPQQVRLCERPMRPIGAGRQLDNFECAQLTIEPLEAADEGQYKCEITFSESLDFDKCPAATTSQLSVIARPNEPELLVNGRPVSGALSLAASVVGTFREGDQVRMECQSAGGRPAPRIEWLNATTVAGDLQQQQVQLMRSSWPQKRTSHLAAGEGSQPITSAAVTFALSRHDLRSQFVCLVQATTPTANQQPLTSDQLPRLLASANEGLMFKRIRLDVQVKPNSARLLVRDLELNQTLRQVVSAPESVSLGGQQQQQQQQLAAYSLQPHRLYAIQCLVEGSRPRSRLAWFNRSQPIELEQVELEEADFVVPVDLLRHRLSSFTRTIQLADGTFSTTGTLLFTAQPHDNLEELFCRLSNEAFQLAELVQVAPIMAARLQVNFAPMAWLEPSREPISSNHRKQQQLVVRVDEGKALELRCWLAANPLAHNTIVQLEWLRDGRKLPSSVAKSSGGHQQRLQVEGANHLHMPSSAQDGGQQQLAQSQNLNSNPKLLCSSRLSIARAQKSDSGTYTCQFKLIPAPSDGAAKQPSPRIIQGQAQRPIQVQVIEAKPKRPTIRIASSSGLLVYGLQPTATTQKQTTNVDNQHFTLLADQKASISLRCDFGDSQQQQLSKVMWYLNGQLFHSATSNVHNLTLGSLLVRDPSLGTLSCALYVPGSVNQADFHGGSLRLHQSQNQLNLKLKVGPQLLERRELMPTVRSFSEPELNANPANKLRLVCLAQCEPICSIDWHLNGRQLLLASNNGDPQTMIRPNESTFVSRSRPVLDHSHEQWGQLENLIRKAGNETTATSPFAWNKQTNIQLLVGNGADLEAQWRQLMREAESHQLAAGANVFSRLELTYQQIGQLLSLGPALGVGSLPASDDDDSGQVERANTEQILVKCRINVTLDGRLGHLLVGAHRWFPEAEVEEENFSVGPDGDELAASIVARPIELSRLALNLGTTSNGAPARFDKAAERPEIDNESHQMQPASSAHWTQLELNAIGQQQTPTSLSAATVDEMQISILLEKSPRRVRVKFAGLANSSQEEPGSVTLSEGQLLELVDPNKAPPLFHCQAAGYPKPQFRWTFTDLNQTEHLLASESTTGQLNLRQFIEFRQRQLQVDPSSAYGLDVVSGIVGNYTCTASNIHGSRQASMPIQIQGRPLCKLTLGKDFVTPNNELMVNLVCSVYSNPLLLETLWFRNGQQLVANKTSLDSMFSLSKSPLTRVELPVMLMGEQKNSMLMNLISNQLADFKCIARNPLGFSEACELIPAHRQALIGAITTTQGGSNNSKIPTLSILLNNFPLDIRSQTPAPINLLSSNSSDLVRQPSFGSFMGLLFRNIDLVLIIAFSLIIAWLLIMTATAFVRRHFSRKPSGSMLKVNHNASWRPNGTEIRRELAIQEPGQPIVNGLPYQSKMIANYYGGSNGDSEHDMIQSCSQSSHYEDYGVQNQHLQLQQRLLNQPLYFNGNMGTSGTLQNTRPRHLKPSLSSDSSTGTRLTRLNCHQELIYNAVSEQPSSNGTKSASTMRDALILNNSNRFSTGGGGLTNLKSSNVPLINGTTTRIDLDEPKMRNVNYQRGCDNNRQLAFCSQIRNTNSEHIYDDVIYNQIIL